jgi:uncharacterized membrane protein YjfL (UPF0719 family)
MLVYVKYLILLAGFYAAFVAIQDKNIAAGIVAAGSFIGYAIIEIKDVEILNKEEKE